jgi:curved DNA-binding protein CbpA
MNFEFDENALYDFYEILEIDKDATPKQIRENFIKLVKKHHPDHGGNAEMYEKLMRAFECLINEKTRKEYDLKQQTSDKNYNLITHFKNDFINFKDSNFVPKTKDEIDTLYLNIFNTTEKDNTINEDEFSKYIMDIKTEREQYEIETVNNDLKNILDNNPEITFNDLVDYFKTIDKKNTELIEYKAFNEPNGFSKNFNFINETPDKIKYDDCNISKEHIQNFSINAYNEWKNSLQKQKKITKNDVEKYMKMREEQDIILQEIIAENFKQIENTTSSTMLYLQQNT